MAKAQTVEVSAPAAPVIAALASAPPAPAGPLRAPQYRIRESLFRPDIQGYINTVWAADIVDGTPFEELLKPDYWSHVAQKMTIDDSIRAFAEDGSWYAVLLVRDRGHNWVKVAVLERYDLDPMADDLAREASGYRVEWRGRIDRHAVVRISDNAVVGALKGFSSESEARGALAEYVKALRR